MWLLIQTSVAFSFHQNKSHATKFLVEEDGSRLPINSISGMGNIAAKGIFSADQEEPFSSMEDVKSVPGSGVLQYFVINHSANDGNIETYEISIKHIRNIHCKL